MEGSIFGWSYPPGVSSVPGDEPDPPCEVCGGYPELDCICPECPVCGTFGDPLCYEKHGLVRTSEQIEQLARKEKEWEEIIKIENSYWDRLSDEASEVVDSILSEEPTQVNV